ncbi:MAG: hydantoinase/carbamoylase family amidase [Pseudomonadota bacterium]
MPTPLDTAHRLFDDLATNTADPPGVTRASFGAGEAYAHAMIAREARRIGLAWRTDAIGNGYATLPGRDRRAPVLMIGSHLDSVPHGGNFDGAAGVIAGLALLEHLAAGPAPPVDVTVMVIRAEEMVWFPQHYLGSRAAFGLLPRDLPDSLCRSDTGRTLADHMAEAGVDPAPIREGRALLGPARIRAFVELHIEQGPVLVERAVPVGIVTAIRGNIRYRFAKIRGETTHAGGVPRTSRRDAVLAGAELAAALEAEWLRLEGAGADFVLTLGQFATDPRLHGITRVPGAVDFTLDMRSIDPAVLVRFDAMLQETAGAIARRRGVTIDLGPGTRAAEAAMDHGVRRELMAAADAAGIAAHEMASGGGHDCAVFASLGVPAAMIFVRNENGSHNPDEAMDFGDFAAAWTVLKTWAEAHLAAI